MTLLRSQQNAIFDIITATKYFAPTMFKVEDNAKAYTLKYVGTKFYFNIANSGISGIDFHMTYSPAKLKMVDEIYSSWEEFSLYFRGWLSYLEREVTAVDKWGRLFDEMNYLHMSTPENEQNFTHEEYIDLERKLTSIKASIAAIPLLPGQIEAINYKLDHLLTLTTQLNKFDWQGLFIGTIVGQIIDLGITTENAQLLYALIKQTFHGLFLQ